MEVTINYNGQAVAVEVTLEVYEFLDRADHKTENLFHEQRRHWDGREFDEYIITTEGVGAYEKTLNRLRRKLGLSADSNFCQDELEAAVIKRFRAELIPGEQISHEYVDEDMRLRLETKLIHSIVTSFKVLPA